MESWVMESAFHQFQEPLIIRQIRPVRINEYQYIILQLYLRQFSCDKWVSEVRDSSPCIVPGQN